MSQFHNVFMILCRYFKIFNLLQFIHIYYSPVFKVVSSKKIETGNLCIKIGAVSECTSSLSVCAEIYVYANVEIVVTSYI